jgi:hypothetical protein
MRLPDRGTGLLALTLIATLARAAPAKAYEPQDISCPGPCVRNVRGEAVALRSFDLRLTGDDRHVRGLHAAPNDRIEGPETQILLSMWDEYAGPRDFHRVEMAPTASFYDLTAIARFGQVHVDRCRGECRLDLDLTSDETFVLAGIFLQYLSDPERDHHVKRIAVVPGRDGGGAYVRVAMLDDDGRRPIAATVHYLAVPSRYVATTRYADSGQRGVTGVFSEPRQPGPAVLRGFSVNWSEDHHFKRLMVDVGDGRVRAAFHDNDADRRFEHFVYYAILREPDDG